MLHQRTNKRFDRYKGKRLEQRSLAERGISPRIFPPFAGGGYRQPGLPGGGSGVAMRRYRGIVATRQLAKRQG